MYRGGAVGPHELMIKHVSDLFAVVEVTEAHGEVSVLAYGDGFTYVVDQDPTETLTAGNLMHKMRDYYLSQELNMATVRLSKNSKVVLFDAAGDLSVGQVLTFVLHFL